MSGSVSFLTMGCAKNEVDSQQMQKDLVRAGYSIVELGQPCDAVVVNTCSFIQSAIEESIDAIFEIAGQEPVKDGTTKLIVCGCLPSRFGDDLAEELTEADRFVPCSEEDDIVEVMDAVLACSVPREQAEVVFDAAPSEYVKISDGCNRFCSFCTIPFIRGRYHSFSYESIVADVAEKVKGGAREIVLIAQDSGIWGRDLEERSSLASLLDRLAPAFPETWFRVMYLQPAGLTDDLLDVMVAHPNICRYFDIPLQHCDPDILKSMNRSGSREEIEAMVARVRERVPGVALRTTLIVGYPGETEEQFEELCDFVEEVEFDYVGIFAYSPEEGTRAAELPDQIDDDTKQDRVQRLRDISDAVSSARIAERVGQQMDVLVLGTEDDGQLYGRAMCQAPDVDGVVYLEEGEVGSLVSVEIADTLLYEMEA